MQSAGGARWDAGKFGSYSIFSRTISTVTRLLRQVLHVSAGLCLALSVTSTAVAGTFTVFGPQVFQRGSGAPVAQTHEFPVLDPSAQYTLNVFNGGVEDDEVTGDMVSSGYVNVNGVEVVGEHNFNQNFTTLSEAITLSLQNQLSVEVRGKPGGGVAISITGIDDVPPTITASAAPAPMANGWNTSAVTVSFECSDDTSGVQECPDPVAVSTEGASQVISGTTTDNAGNTAMASVTLNIDTTPPTLAFQSPAAGSVLQTTTPPIDVIYSDNITVVANTLQFTVNGASLAVSCQSLAGGATCTPSAALPEGSVTLAASMQDTAGTTGTAQVAFQIVTDSDGDGVSDTDDQCPGTPGGETVDASGCAASQLDDDNDGVTNANDQCPGTPSGESVDGNGCSPSQLDSDGDGVNDAADQCPGTPAGESVNFYGCALSQIDTDGDGHPDHLDAFPNDPAEWSDLDGDGVGDNSDADRDGDGVDNAADAFPDNPAEWADRDGDGIGDNSDPDRDGDGVNNDDDYFPDDPNATTVPQVSFTSPQNLTTVGASPVSVAGTINDPSAVLTVNGVTVSHTNGSFQASVQLEEGHNAIVARAVDTQGHEGTDSLNISLDKTPPYITIESPMPGSTVSTNTTAVTGLVNDIVRGTITDQDAVVTVNGIQASVANRTYLAEDVPLSQGVNVITVSASDAVGNTASTTATVTYAAPVGPQIVLAGGQGQSGQIRSTLTTPLSARLLDDAGQPVAGKNVVFRVIQGDGAVAAGLPEASQGALAVTDAQGIANTSFKLGWRAGDGIHRVRARAVGFNGEAVFYARATPQPGNKLGVIAGNNQRGIVRQPLPEPLVVAVTDTGSNLIAGAQVEFRVTKGGGKFENEAVTYVAVSDSDGRASASWVLGPEEGLDVQRVTATLIGTNATAGFTGSGFMPGDPGQTAISGVVLDNQDKPVPGVTVRVDGTTRQAIADAQGQFTIDQVPVGPVHLIADGSTATVAGEWPSLSYNIVTVAGVDNPLSAPIYMVKLDTANAVTVGAQDVEYTLPEIPGFKLTVKAGSVTFPDGSNTGQLSVTAVNANKIPMPPPNAMQPQLIVTIQPTGAMFDPPAPLTLPNVDGHAPGAQVEMYSYDHDLEEFVIIGLGTVSKDGSVIESNPGVGVVKAGWHCGSQPQGNGCTHNCPICQDCDGNCNCINADLDPRLKKCEKCSSGSKSPIPEHADKFTKLSDTSECPDNTQHDKSKGYDIDGCSYVPDSLDRWGNFQLVDYSLYVTNPIWGSVLGTVSYEAGQIQYLPCNKHDVCYQTCGSVKSTCDAELNIGVGPTCDQGYPHPCSLSLELCEKYEIEYRSCLDIGSLTEERLGAGLTGWLANNAFEDGQVKGCYCCKPE